MQRRPWPIVILAFLQIFVEPFTNILFSAWLSDLSPFAYLKEFIHEASLLQIFYLLILPPIMGASIYAMKAWSYPIFVGGATWTVIRNFSNLNGVSGVAASVPFSVGLYVSNLAFAAYFLLPRVKAPFLNQRLRWWETAKRYLVDFSARLETDSGSFPCRIRNCSVGGVFIQSRDNFPLGEVLRLRFSPNAKDILAVKVKLVFTQKVGSSLNGYGAQFVQMNELQRSAIRDMIIELKTAQCPTRENNVSAREDFVNWARDLLATGHGLVPETDAERALYKAKNTALENVSDSGTLSVDSDTSDEVDASSLPQISIEPPPSDDDSGNKAA